MSEAEVQDAHATSSRPAYGEGRIVNDTEREVDERLERNTHVAIALAIVMPVIAVYGASAYGVYRAASAIF
jgi:hypothetical protein